MNKRVNWRQKDKEDENEYLFFLVIQIKTNDTLILGLTKEEKNQ